MSRPILWLLCGLMLSVPVRAQEDQKTVSSRLLEILLEKGTIDKKEFVELKDLEKTMAEEQDLEAQLEDDIAELVTTIGRESETTYKPGRGFTWSWDGGRHTLTMGGRAVIRFSYMFPDEGENMPDFDVKAARVWWRGNAFSKDIKYKFQIDIAGDEAEGSGYKASNRLTELKDAHVDWTKYKAFRIRAGQFKAPYSRHQLTSSGKQGLVDRSPINGAFAPGRQVGVMIYGDFGSETNEQLFQYFAGVFDGEGENFTNNDTGLMAVGRIVINPFGAFKLSDGDFRRGEKREEFLMSVGLNAWWHSDDNKQDPDDPDSWSVGFDVAIAYYGFFLLAEFHHREVDMDLGEERTGGFVQLGYSFLVAEDPDPEWFEVTARVSHIDYDDSSRTYTDEYLLGLGYFWQAHLMKLQLDIGRVEAHRKTSESDQWIIRIQFQVFF